MNSGGEVRGKAVKCVMGFLQRAPMSAMEPTKITNCLLPVDFKKQQCKAKQNRTEKLKLCTSATRGGNEATFPAENLQRLWEAFWSFFRA